MSQPIYNFLISHGLTNLIDIDGLVYAPVLDFLAALLGLVLVVVFCWLCQSVKCNHPSKDG